jgi:spore coat polysaccharide biosynthesis protein SpsF
MHFMGPGGNGKPMIQHLIERLKPIKLLDEIVMATTDNESDNVLVDLAKTLSIASFRGSESDVMSRVLGAAEASAADVIVGITGDCPLIDSELVAQTVKTFLINDCDYVNNAGVPGYPGGMNTQVYSLDTLRHSSGLAVDAVDREHVTSHILRNPELYRPILLAPPPELDRPDVMLELDEPNDYRLLKKIIEHFGETSPLFSCRQILALLDANPSWLDINKAVRRKGFE